MRSVRVKVGEKQYSIENVPDGLKARALIDGLRERFDKNAGDPVIQIQGRVLEPEDPVADDEIEIVFLQSKKGWTVKGLCIGAIWIAVHLLPFICVFHSEYRPWSGIALYIIGVIFMLLVTGITNSKPDILKEVTRVRAKDNVILEVIILFFRSCMPGFRLENLLLND